MRAHTITTTINRAKPSAWHLAVVLGLAVCSLVVPATASASPIGSSDYSSAGAPNDSSQSVGGSGYSSVNAISPPSSASSPAGGSGSGSDYSSLNAISGAPASEPVLASGGPSNPADGFDWGSAAVGAGTVLAMVALGSAALLTVRRRTTVAPSASS
ncbi:MAG: hypothetical protein ACRDK9_11270 [Solirubrobacterales bacterium]